jgi:signal transduction histidine kinase
LQRQIFVGFGLAILATMLLSSAVFGLFHASHGAWSWMRFFALFVAGNVVWSLSGVAARRLAQPLRELSRVAAELGAGKLESRVRLPRRGTSEVRELAATFNDMAERVESQVKSQRELLGAVSHELRTPLARMRVLLAILQEREQAGGATVGGDAAGDTSPLAKIEREIVEMDALVGELLAGARVDAGALERRSLRTDELLQACLERAPLTQVALELAPDAAELEADATLLARALSILLDNAYKHGATRASLRVTREGARVRFALDDDGPGFAPADLKRAFEPFARGQDKLPDERGGVGLGLYLLRRIAEAHGGSVFAENLGGRGARVGFTV